jgi:uncharacterized repeat protein (TIGR01451 family)
MADTGAREPEPQEEKRNKRRGLLAWLLLVLFSLCVLFACAQLAGLSMLNPPQQADLQSNLEADYSPWGYVAFGPINPQILLDILDDLKLNELRLPSLSGSCLLPGGCPTATPTLTPTETDTPTITPTPSDTPTPSWTPTASNTFTATPTASLTPSPTPLVYPVKLANPDKVDPELTQTVTFTILVINYGSLPPANLETVCDFLPAGLTYVANSANPSGSYEPCPNGGGMAVVWTTNVSIPQGAFSRFTFQAESDHPTAGATFTNTVMTYGGNFDTATNWRTVYAYTPTPTATPVTIPTILDDAFGGMEDTPIAPGTPGVLANDTDSPWDTLAATQVVNPPAYGDVTLNNDGSFNYQTTPDWYGYDSFVYRACDQGGSCGDAAVTLAVTPLPDAPRASDDTYSPYEETPYVEAAPGVLANDRDPDILTGTPYVDLTVEPTPLATPQHGTLVLNSDGSFTYQGELDFFGTPDYFDYQVCDGPSSCDTGRANLNVINVNDDPVAVDDGSPASPAVITDEDTPITYDVVANDIDVDGDTLSVDLIPAPGPLHGNVTFSGGDITYTPDTNYWGTDSFTYRVTDGIGNPDIGAVYVMVNPIDDPPTAVADTYTVSQFGGPVTLDVLSNDVDTIEPADVATFFIQSIVTAPANPAVIATPSATPPNSVIVYDPNPTGTATPYHDPLVPDTFSYQVCDTNNDGATPQSACDTGNVSVIVNDAPQANSTGTPDAYTVDEDTLLTVGSASATPPAGVLLNDSDPNGDSITMVLDATPSHVGGTNGAFSWNSNGSFTYQSELNYNGTDSFTYHVTDGAMTSTPVAVSITVNPVNDAPVANDDPIASPPTANDPDPDLYTVDQGGSLSVTGTDGVLGNDTDADNEPPTPANFGLTAVIDTPPTHILLPGNFALGSDGSFVYTPDPAYVGFDTFTYHANDGTVDSNVATVTIKVNGAPVASDDSYSTSEDTPLSVPAAGVLGNDSDPNSDPITAFVVAAPSHDVTPGGFVLSPDGSFTYTPEGDFDGTDTFTYRATDGRLNSNLATVTITINPVDDPPVANDDPGTSPPPNPNSYETDEDTPLNVPAAQGVKRNDTDVEDDPFTPQLVSGPSHDVTPGGFALNSDGSFTYTPETDYNGIDTFTYQDCEDAFPPLVCSTAPATVTITINAVNDPPVANPDSYTVGQGGSLTPAAPGVLGNDTDVEGDPLTAVWNSGPAHAAPGGFNLSSDGSFTYTPEAAWHGIDSFTYHANDGSDDSNTTTVTILVDDPPTTTDDSYSTDEDTTLVVDASDDPTLPLGLLFNDTDPNGDSPLTASKLSDPAHGSVTVSPDGSFSYTPASDYNGGDSFTYEACDTFGLCTPGTVTITINPVNDPPDPQPDGVYNTYDNPGGPENNEPLAPIVVSAANGVLANDGDIDGPLPLTAQLVTPPSHRYSTDPADFTLYSDGSFRYNAADGYTGTDSFTYQACDALLACSAAATVDLYVDSLPVANNDGYSVAEDTPLTVDASDDPTAPVGVLFNDTDSNPGDTLTAVLDTGPSHAASFTLLSDGSFDYTPEADWHGTDSFTYYNNDGYFDSTAEPTATSATVTITVTSVPDTPEAADDSYSVDEDSSLSVPADGVLGNDTDPDNLTAPYNGGLSVTTPAVSGPSHAQSFNLNSNGSFSYQPDDDYYGPDSFDYEVCDGTSRCDTATVNITVNPVDDTPVAADDSDTTDEDTPVTIDVLANDTDPDNLSVPFNAGLTVDDIPNPASNGTVTNNGTDVTYAPDANWSGSDQFTYTVCDGSTPIPLCDSATVFVTVNSVPDTPSAADDSYSVDEDNTLSVPVDGVLSNDIDNDNLPPSNAGLTVTTPAVSAPSHAQSFSLNSNGSFSYQPDDDYNGPDSFDYEVCDGTSRCDTATVSINIIAVDDAPVAADDSDTTDEDTSVTIDVLANDTDPDNLSAPFNAGLTVDDIPNPASNGTVTNNGTDVTYAPDANWSGSDQFTYTVCDGSTPIPLCDSATVFVTVNPVNDPPVANDDDAGTIGQGTSVATDVLANDTDVESHLDPNSLTVIAQPARGSAAVNPSTNQIVFSDDPAGGPQASLTYTYQVCDTGQASDGPGGPLCDSANVSLIVNDAPVAIPDAYTVDEDRQLTIPDTSTPTPIPGVLDNDSDPNSDPITAVLDSAPSHTSGTGGSFTFDPADGSFSYHPDLNYNGPDSFTYHATDGAMDSSTVTVDITVNPVNDPPTAEDVDLGLIDQGDSVPVDLTGHVSDIDGSIVPSSIQVISGPSHGSTTNDGAGTITYTHDGGPDLTDSYTYEACDDGSPTPAECAQGTVSITIRQPVLTVQLDPDSITASRNEIVEFTASYWNDGPGTAYGTTVTVSAGSGCNVITGNPIFSGDMASMSAAFRTVRVRAPNAEGASCTVTADMTSTNGTSSSDSSTIDVPAPAAAFSLFSFSFSGDALDAGTPTPTGTPAAMGGGPAATDTPDPAAPPTDTPSASDTPAGGASPSDTPVASNTPDPATSPTDTPVSSGAAATDTPEAVPANTSAPPPAAPSETPVPAPTSTEAPVAASSVGPAKMTGDRAWWWLQLMLPLGWLTWMLVARKDRKGSDL